MKIFLTGATGFIGSHILQTLVKNDHQVYALARNSEKASLITGDNVHIVLGSITDEKIIKETLKHCDAVIHVALFWGETDSEILQHDTLASVRLFEITKESGSIKKFIYTSSTSATGYYQKLQDEETPLKPQDHYGASKAATEMFLHSMSFSSDISTTVIRPGYTFGEPAYSGGDIEVDNRFKDIVRNAINNDPIEVTKNDGTQFIHADDLSEIYLKALENTSSYEVYFGLSGEFATWENIAKHAIKIAKSSSQLVVTDSGYSDDPLLFSTKKIERDFSLSFKNSEKLQNHVTYLFNEQKVDQ